MTLWEIMRKALKGFVFYMLGRALLNYDRLSYDAQVDDYCACFGAAGAEIRRYLDELERLHMRAAEMGEGIDALLSIYPIERLSSILDKAATLVADDAAALGRVDFLRKGVSIAREELKLHQAWASGAWAPLRNARKS